MPSLRWRHMGGLLCLSMLLSCQKQRTIPETLLRALEGADRIEIQTRIEALRSMHDSYQIRRIADWTKRFSGNWDEFWESAPAPVPDLIFRFYKGQNALHAFGIGNGFITTGERQLWVQNLSETDRNEILRLLRLKDLPPSSERP